MSQTWITLAHTVTRDGTFELRQRGSRDFLITLNNLVLMNSVAHRSEEALGTLACQHLSQQAKAKVLIGGLGMGFTLKAVLSMLPASSMVTIAELNSIMVDWCHGPLADLTQNAIDDPRVTIVITDVADLIKQAAVKRDCVYDAIVLDLYSGPHAGTHKRDDPLYGSIAIDRMSKALTPNGILAVWGESIDTGFVKRLTDTGFDVRTSRPGKGGLRHVVYLAQKIAGAVKGKHGYL